MGTAMMIIIHRGTTNPARVLNDPASESSFLSNFENTQICELNHGISATYSKK